VAEFESSSKEIAETEIEGVTRYVLGNTTVYKILVENLPNVFTNVYLILDREASLVDVGFDGEKSRADLEKGFEIINKEFKESIGVEEVSHIIITHGHLDHFGMLTYQRLKGRRLYIHELDSGSVKNFEEENYRWRERLAELIKVAGWELSMEKISLLPQFLIEPGDYDLIEVKDRDEIINGYTVYHTPGHSLGEICLKVGDLIFLGDHMLSFTTPHQSSKSTGGAGLEAYLSSLKKTAKLDTKLGLPAHEDTIYSVKARVVELESFHHQRLAELVELGGTEKTLDQLTREYYERHPELMESAYTEEFSEMNNWIDNWALALDEIAAHVEYLLENSRMEITKIENGVVKYKSRGIKGAKTSD
jgi:glyoxylase-like metal-dependent hydrolase (beta-lactamase superfamily II)